jgi:hypothetical protein
MYYASPSEHQIFTALHTLISTIPIITYISSIPIFKSLCLPTLPHLHLRLNHPLQQKFDFLWLVSCLLHLETSWSYRFPLLNGSNLTCQPSDKVRGFYQLVKVQVLTLFLVFIKNANASNVYFSKQVHISLPEWFVVKRKLVQLRVIPFREVEQGIASNVDVVGFEGVQSWPVGSAEGSESSIAYLGLSYKQFFQIVEPTLIQFFKPFNLKCTKRDIQLLNVFPLANTQSFH